jgi:hypothetical protein
LFQDVAWSKRLFEQSREGFLTQRSSSGRRTDFGSPSVATNADFGLYKDDLSVFAIGGGIPGVPPAAHIVLWQLSLFETRFTIPNCEGIKTG